MIVDVPAGVEEDFVTRHSRTQPPRREINVTGHSRMQPPRRETNRYLINWLTLHGGESSGRGGFAAGEFLTNCQTQLF